MSGYSKNHQYVYDAEATRSNQAANYPGIAQPAFASQYTDVPAGLTHEASSAEMPYIPSSTHESRGAAEHRTNRPFIDAGARHPASLTVTETEITEPITPAQGTAGSTVTLQLRTNYDLQATQRTFILMFGTKKCVAALQKVDYDAPIQNVDYDDDDQWYNYVLNVEVPPFPLTNTWDPTMMLKLQIEDKMGHLQSQTDAGKFTYTDMSPNLAYQSSPDFSRKRKYSTEFRDTQDYPDGNSAKRVQSRQFAKPRTIPGAYSAAQVSPLPSRPVLPETYRHGGGYDLSKQAEYGSQISQKGLYAVPSGIGMAHADYKLPHMSPNLHSYSSYNARNHGSRHPVSTSASILPPPPAMTAPVLVRATHLAQASSNSSSAQPFNPYSMYQSKAILKIDGDLDKMSEDWTQEEVDAKRRLVEFKRSQRGSTIMTSFAPIAPEARQHGSICVSCIWWEEKDECYITSVNVIYLLEQLVNVRFTVEEKNRIRRNLEGFRPLTIAKAKADSETFFKVIMGFPDPKPRNIEKDVKVFPWKILSHALKKIISKYSASYSSTAGIGPLPVPSTSTYSPGGVSQATMDAHRITSPQSVPISIVSTAYTPNLTSSSLSPHLKMEGSAGHGMPIAQRTPSGQGMTQWGAPTHHMPQYPANLSHGERGSWDYGYLGTSAPTGLSHSLQMPRPNATSDLTQMAADHAYHQYAEGTTRV
ncbi:hypothetical protein A1F94_006572 [Pyrenophora tritici-repentis]|nr:hypothetical protein PtrV1_13717 [Pyrenophora tritici-repentis]KAF7447252.1 hypothetical protein A1F99_086990 [Pyrenophora tritici-repentis]KAG9382651.1 hypothetical protein A1F94_006572 [Pyrenophora tritici-repentis]KAI1535980.1 hypothetical protein PtrSN001A_005808 [Pyrenophora tritici-repentis]KAI1539732.1 hypothetical protein PtrSN001C_005222 [Pyrenophora tritici-repentis]